MQIGTQQTHSKALSACAAFGAVALAGSPLCHASSLQWRVTEAGSPSKQASTRALGASTWRLVPQQTPQSVAPSSDARSHQSIGLSWQTISTQEAQAEDLQDQPEPPEAVVASSSYKSLPPTYGGYRDLYRLGRWYPSVTTIIPMGFGPQGLMLGLGVSGADCKPESKTCINYPNVTQESIQNVGEAVFDSYIGFGDPQKAISVLITNASQGVYRASGGSYFGGNHTGVAVSRNLWQGAAIKLGAEGLFRENSPQADLPKSAFGVISQHIPLKPINSKTGDRGWFPDLYLTAGLGNGLFRPSDAVISAQIQSAKDAGCWYTACSPEKTQEAYLRGTEWGNLYPIGSVALAINEQANFIAEWTGRNLNLSLSLQPVAGWGWTITPGIGNLVQNSDYGKNVNIPACSECDMGDAITTRPIFYLRSMINIKF